MNNWICAGLAAMVAFAATAGTEGSVIVSHRGSRGEYQDNAAGGFAWCLQKGLRGFETDIRFTKDHRLVIMHDRDVSRTTDGQGVVEELTFEELRKFRLNSCSAPVPTLAEVLDAFKGREGLRIELEMKAYKDAFYTDEVLAEYCRAIDAEVRKAGLVDSCFYTCFDTNTLAVMRREVPTSKLGYITGKPLTDEHLDLAAALGCVSVAPKATTTKEMVKKAHDRGFFVCLWFAQNLKEYEHLRKLGADSVTTDYPHLLSERIAGKSKRLVFVDPVGITTGDGLDADIRKKNAEALKTLEMKLPTVIMPATGVPSAFVAACAAKRQVALDDVVFVGTDFADVGRNASVRTKGIDRIVISDKIKFHKAIEVLYR